MKLFKKALKVAGCTVVISGITLVVVEKSNNIILEALNTDNEKVFKMIMKLIKNPETDKDTELYGLMEKDLHFLLKTTRSLDEIKESGIIGVIKRAPKAMKTAEEQKIYAEELKNKMEFYKNKVEEYLGGDSPV